MKLARTHIAAAIALAALMLCASACTDKALQIAALSVRVAGTANDTLRQVVVSEQAAGTIAPLDAAKILAFSDKITAAVAVAEHLTNDYQSFPAGQKPALHAVIAPLVNAVKEALDSGLAGIKDPVLKQRLTTILISVQAALDIADVALGAK